MVPTDIGISIIAGVKHDNGRLKSCRALVFTRISDSVSSLAGTSVPSLTVTITRSQEMCRILERHRSHALIIVFVDSNNDYNIDITHLSHSNTAVIGSHSSGSASLTAASIIGIGEYQHAFSDTLSHDLAPSYDVVH